MGTESQHSTAVPAPTIGELAKRGGVALLVAVVATVAFVTAANLAGVNPAFEAYTPLIAARGTALGVAGATLVYGIVSRVSEDPNRHFTIIAGVVYLLALVPVALRAPGMPGSNTLGVALLPVVHAIAAIPPVVFLTERR